MGMGGFGGFGGMMGSIPGAPRLEHKASIGDAISGGIDAAEAGISTAFTGKEDFGAGVKVPVGRSPGAIKNSMSDAYEGHQISKVTKEEYSEWSSQINKFMAAHQPPGIPGGAGGFGLGFGVPHSAPDSPHAHS
jgi:hypothetical protein